jgi:two-component system, OmpR family, sensor histidine kinase MtrB
MKRTLSLQRFFLAIALLLLTAGCGIAVVLFLFTGYLHHAAKGLYESVESIYAAEELEAQLQTYYRESALYQSNTQDTAHRGRRDAARKGLDFWLQEVGKHMESSKEEDLVMEVKQEVAAYLAAVDAIPLQGLKSLELFHRGADLLVNASDTIEKLIQLNREQAGGLQKDVDRRDRMANILGIAVVALLTVLIPGLLLWMRSFIYLPLTRIRTVISRLGAGETEARAPSTGPTEIREIAEVFNLMADNLKRGRESQLRSLAAVAHEIKNPLGALKMSLQLLAPSFLTTLAEREETLRVISRQIDQMERQVGDLLDAARIEAGQFELKLSDEDLRGCASASVALYQAASPAHSIELSVAEEQVLCRCDPLRIGQIINNFLSNAIKYSPNGGPIRVSVERDGAEAVVAVADRGMGIAPADRERIFEPFLRSAASRVSAAGVGLGLSVSRHIAEAHGGRIEVESTPGQGSTFRLRLKADEQPVPCHPEPKGSA